VRPFYELPFDEILALVAKGETIVSHCGYLIHSKDRKFDERYALDVWHAERRKFLKSGVDMQPNIQSTKQISSSPVNAKGRPFSWSYSSLANFEGCPKRYAHEKYWCDTPFVESEAIIWGNRVHKAAEQALKGEKVDEPELLKPIEKYINLFKAQESKGAKLHAELEIVLDENLKPVKGKRAWFSEKAWYRGKLDVVVINGANAYYYDWKTGNKVRDDEGQLKICCAALSTVKPKIKSFTPKLIWTKHDTVTGIKEGSLSKNHIREIWSGTLKRVKRMEEAWRTGNFPARPSALCGWCLAKDKCEYRR